MSTIIDETWHDQNGEPWIKASALSRPAVDYVNKVGLPKENRS